MANEYRTWFASDEQEYLIQADEFLQHVVGWYRVFTHTDSSTDRRYTWLSEGEDDDKRPPRLVSIHGVSNEIRFDALLVADNGFNFITGAFNTHVGDHVELEFRAGVPGRCRTVASKDRVCPHTQTGPTSRYTGYLGFIDSFYSTVDDPNPILVRGQSTSFDDWVEDNGDSTRMLRSDDTEQPYTYNWNTAAVNEGYPNPRGGSYSFYRPILYYGASLEYYELRGRLKGVYYGRADKLAHGSFIKIGEEFHLVVKTTDENGATIIGPASSDGQVPINYGWQPRPNLETNYTYRGLEIDLAVSGTLALWRFDTGHLDNYTYGSGASLPVPITYADETGNYDLTAQNGVTSVQSRLREAIDLDGSTHYASTAGDGAADALKGEWTFECVFMPDTIPTASARATLIDYGDGGGAAVSNTLLKVSVSPAIGVTPDVYNVGRGNIEISWEKDTGTLVSNITSSDFVQQNRWNYLAVVKKYNGATYDIDIWHCSFGDHLVPVKKASFTGMDNATDGTISDWYIGTTEALASYFDGQLDDTRITERVLSDEEILTSCTRTML